MPSTLVSFWSWITQSTKWRKQQGAEDHVAEVAQEEHGGADPDPGNAQEEDDVVDPSAGNADVPAVEESVPLPEDEEGEDEPLARVEKNRRYCQYSLKFSRDSIQDSFYD